MSTNDKQTALMQVIEREKKLMQNAWERHHKYGLAKSVYDAHKENVKFFEKLLPKDMEILKKVYKEGFEDAAKAFRPARMNEKYGSDE